MSVPSFPSFGGRSEPAFGHVIEPGLTLPPHFRYDFGMLGGRVDGFAGVAGDVIELVTRLALYAPLPAALQAAEFRVSSRLSSLSEKPLLRTPPAAWGTDI